jgi:hypothetical protein
MRTDPQQVSSYLAQAEFVIPAYQRPYQWADDLLEGLWSDLGEMYVGTNTKHHYIGVLLSIAETSPVKAVRGVSPQRHGRTVWSLVDGQQRLVTILLLLAALRDWGTKAVKRDAKVLLTANDGKSPRLLGQEEDRELLTRILLTADPVLSADELRTTVGNAYGFFLRQLHAGSNTFWKPISKRASSSAPNKNQQINTLSLFKVVTQRLSLTDMMLDATDQSAPAVFDAINGKRRELEPVDLLRNTVFAELNDIQLFTDSWAKIETESRSVKLGGARLGTLPLFIDSYLHSLGHGASQYRLARRLNELILEQAPMNIGAQKRRAKVQAVVAEIVVGFDDFKLAQSSAFGGYEGQRRPEAVRTLDNISMLSSGPPLPLSLLFLRYRRIRFLNDAQLLKVVRILESYLARRVVAGERQQLLRSHLGTVAGKLIKEFGNASSVGAKAGSGKAADLAKQLTTHLNAGGMAAPGDKQLATAAQTRLDMNKLSARQRFAVLRRLNDEIAGRHIDGIRLATQRKGSINYSIEHVFPDSFKDPSTITDEWKKQLKTWGQSAAQVKELISLRNNIGNYTLVHQNSALGRRAFLDVGRKHGKRRILKDRAVDVSSSVVNQRSSTGAESQRDSWTAAELRSRAKYLAAVLKAAYPLG